LLRFLGAEDQPTLVDDNLRRRPRREVPTGARHRRAQRASRVTEPRPQHDAYPRQLVYGGPNGGCRGQGPGVGGQLNTPAIVAVMKLASVPATIARIPSRARSWRRVGASEPMPPI